MPTSLHRTAARRVLALAVLVPCLLAGLAACTQQQPKKPEMSAAEKAAREEKARKDREFYLGTRAAQQDIRDLFARVDGAAPHQWAQIAQKLVSYGEPAVPQMIANLDSHEKSVAVMAAYCLGMIQDPRALDPLARAMATPHEKLRFEAATAMLRMGDRRGLPTMIDGLEHPDPLVRARAILVLKERTGGTMGYAADGRPEDRAAAVARWRAWLARGGGVMPPRTSGAGTPGG